LLGSTQLWPQNTENAQSAENAADNPKRQELIRAAQKARRAGDHEQALSLAGQAAQIWLTPSLRLFIAEEQSATEQFTNALVNAERGEVEAEKDDKLKNRETILRACRSLIVRLKKFTAQVIVVMPTPPPLNPRVRIGGHEVPDSLYGKPYLLPPGKITVEASAPGHVPFAQEVTAEAGKEVTVSVGMAAGPTPVAPPKPPPPAVPQARAVGCGGAKVPTQRVTRNAR